MLSRTKEICRKLFHKTFLMSHFSQSLRPIYNQSYKNKTYRFYTPNQLTYWRADSLFSKEPETIDWIDTFEDNDVFFDIGANVGLYSIYAGINKKDIRVYAFEPTSFNFWLLNRNISLNGLENKITALCVALSDTDKVDYLYMPHIIEGAALITLGNNVDLFNNTFETAFKQGSLSYSLDSFVGNFHLPIPNHIKIDVDGLEPRIIAGAMETLRRKEVKSILIEINEGDKAQLELIESISNLGFKLKHKKHADIFEQTVYKDCYNYIFFRESH